LESAFNYSLYRILPYNPHLLQNGYDIRTVQELLRHKNVKTMIIYTHVLNRGGKAVRSLLIRITGIYFA